MVSVASTSLALADDTLAFTQSENQAIANTMSPTDLKQPQSLSNSFAHVTDHAEEAASSSSTPINVTGQDSPSPPIAADDGDGLFGGPDAPGIGNPGSVPASLPPPTPGLAAPSDIEQEELKVVRWARKDVYYVNRPDAQAWLVHTVPNTDNATNARIWTTPSYLEELISRYTLASNSAFVAATTRASSFSRGRPIEDISVKIRTCVGDARPTTLYRAVHDGMPFDGICARGFEVITTNSLFFQRHLQNHLKWTCRQPSPFLSASSELPRAASFAAAFAARGRTAIKILEIDTTGVDWDHNISRLWKVDDLRSAFGLHWKEYHRYEYLIENLIPNKHIRVYDWEEEQERLDPDGRLRETQINTVESFKRLNERVSEIRKRKREEEPEEADFEACERAPGTNKFRAVISQRKKRSVVG